MAPVPKREPCVIRAALTEELIRTHSVLAELNNMDVKCILRGDFRASEALTAKMKVARDHREFALETLLKHVEEHHCQSRQSDEPVAIGWFSRRGVPRLAARFVAAKPAAPTQPGAVQ